MEFEWDEAKRAANLAKHGLDFADASQFDWLSAVMSPDLRFAYGEERFIALGTLAGEVVAIAFTLRGDIRRIVSFRPASRKERGRYGKKG